MTAVAVVWWSTKPSRTTGRALKKLCKHCSGRGYECLPASKAYRAIQEYISGLPESS
ncbi:antitermination protein Q [Serratia ficaria]|uniref:antitermination protein Q n=1 Tax=Serratia ficaria TaxID=61651 RepID=UPI003703D917